MSHRLCFCLLCVMIASISPSVAPYGPQTQMLDVTGIGEEISDRFEPKNDDIVKTAVEITKDYPGQININQINEIHKTLKSGWAEKNDPPGEESYFYANQTLQIGKDYRTIGAGDCDDFAILMSSLVEALGGATRVTFAWSPGEVGHVYAEVYLGNESDPHVGELLDWIKSEHGLSDIPGKTVTDGEVWLNLDWFADHPGGPYVTASNRAIVKDSPEMKRSPGIVPLIDGMDDASVWKISRDDKGSSIEIKTLAGKKGNALEISYDLKEDGWVKITRDVDPKKLAGIEGLEFSYKSSGARNSIELGMAYDDSTTFGVSWRPSVAAEWSSSEALYKNFVCLRPGDKCDISGDFNRNKVRRLEFNISNDPGRGDVSGFGTITIDQVQGIMFVPEGSPFAEVAKERQKTIAFELAAKSEEIRDSDLTTSILLAAESMRRYPTPGGDMALRRGLASRAGHVATLVHKGWVNALTFSPDGERVATASGDWTAKVWNVATGDPIATMNQGDVQHAVAFSSDGERVATASYETAKIWNAATGDPLVTVTHDDFVCDVEFSPDGKRFATASEDGTAKLWNASTGVPIITMVHEGWVYDVAFSSDGGKLATASYDGTAKMWNAFTGDLIATMPHESAVTAVAFSPDGSKVSTASWDRSARVWNATTGDWITTVTHDDWVNAVTFSPDGSMIATASDDCTVSVISLVGYNIINMRHEGPVTAIAFSPDGTKVATASDDRTAKLWSTCTGDLIATMPHEGEVNDVSFSPDGSKVATASEDCTANVWRTTSGDLIATMIQEGGVSAVVFSPDGEGLATESYERTAKVWNASTGYLIATITHEIPRGYMTMAFSADGSRIAANSRDNGTANVWNASTGDVIATIIQEDSVDAVELCSDGSRLATASGNNSKVWNASTGEIIATMPHEDWVGVVAFGPDGSRLATSSGNNGIVRIWNSSTGDLIAIMTHEEWVRIMEFSPDGYMLVTVSQYGPLKVWNAITGDLVANMPHESEVIDVVFNLDGSKLATASGDGTATVWNATGGRITTVTHDDWVNAVTFSPDGCSVATASWDGTAKIWNASTGDLITTMKHEGAVNDVAFSPGGSKVATASNDGTTKVWHWRREDIINDACSCLERKNLTEDEWDRYLPGEPYRVTCDLTN